MAFTGSVSCSGGQWTAFLNDEGVLTVVPLSPVGSQLKGSAGGYDVTIKNPCPQPKRTIQYEANFVSCSCNEAIFSIGDPAICTDPKDPGGPCKNETLIKVRWDCCGEFVPDKYYCVSRAAGGPCIPAFLIEEDRCDNDITICSGPYDTELEAAMVCPSGIGGEDCFDEDGLIPPPCFPDDSAILFVPPGETLYWHFDCTPNSFYIIAFDYMLVFNNFRITFYTKPDCVDSETANLQVVYTHGFGGEEEGVEMRFTTGPEDTCICVKIENLHDPEGQTPYIWQSFIDLIQGPECEEE
jgi:hypothetical protein